MKSKSMELMMWICKFSEQYYLRNECLPSTTKIADAMDISRSMTYSYLVEMAENGMIEYDGREIRTSVTRKLNTEMTQMAITESISCGVPQYEEEYIEEYMSLPTLIFGNDDFFILRASGNSIVEAGIDDGNFVVIRKQVVPDDGDIVVALVDNQNILKRFYRDEENKQFVLHPENRFLEDVIVDRCDIQGVACDVIKSL